MSAFIRDIQKLLNDAEQALEAQGVESYHWQTLPLTAILGELHEIKYALASRRAIPATTKVNLISFRFEVTDNDMFLTKLHCEPPEPVLYWYEDRGEEYGAPIPVTASSDAWEHNHYCSVDEVTGQILHFVEADTYHVWGYVYDTRKKATDAIRSEGSKSIIARRETVRAKKEATTT